MKIEGRGIRGTFSATFFLPSQSSDLKVPNNATAQPGLEGSNHTLNSQLWKYYYYYYYKIISRNKP